MRDMRRWVIEKPEVSPLSAMLRGLEQTSSLCSASRPGGANAHLAMRAPRSPADGSDASPASFRCAPASLAAADRDRFADSSAFRSVSLETVLRNSGKARGAEGFIGLVQISISPAWLGFRRKTPRRFAEYHRYPLPRLNVFRSKSEPAGLKASLERVLLCRGNYCGDLSPVLPGNHGGFPDGIFLRLSRSDVLFSISLRFYILISTSTPAGRFKLVSDSMVLGVGS